MVQINRFEYRFFDKDNNIDKILMKVFGEI